MEKAQKYRVVQVRAAYEAGASQFSQWSSGSTVHRGVGWFHPFGVSRYTAGEGFKEAEGFDPDEYFSKYWLDNYGTRLFCIYHMKDGDIYAFDGMFAVRDESDITRDYTPEQEDEKPKTPRRDVLVNVVVGGTGAYKGASGLLMGTAEGGGEQHRIGENSIPDVIMKMMSGYIKLPVCG